MGKRRRAREMAIQMLYQKELGESPLEEIFAAFAPESLRDPAESEPREAAASENEDGGVEAEAFAYARRLVEGTIEHGAQIDELIRRHAENWRLERMPIIDRNILRLAIYEMRHERRVPRVVIVDEAIELAKKFGSENSGRFVNGLLDGFLQADRSSEVSVADGSA